MDSITRQSLFNLVDYLYEDEKRNYDETADLPERQRENHIFIDVQRVMNYLQKPDIQRVKIAVSGGVATIQECPENVEVEIIDYD